MIYSSDSIHFRDGSTITAEVMEIQGMAYLIQTNAGSSQQIQKKDVARILYGSPEQTQKFLNPLFDVGSRLDEPFLDVEILPTLEYGRTILEEAQKAQSSIYVAQYYISGSENEPVKSFYETLQDKARNGVDVTVLAEYGSGTTPAVKFDTFEYGEKLESAGVHARYLMEGKVLHAKIIVIDREIVILGSSNLTSSGTKENEEMNVLIRDKAFAEKVLSDFKELYERALTSEQVQAAALIQH